jgi:hypothetical protein
VVDDNLTGEIIHLISAVTFPWTVEQLGAMPSDMVKALDIDSGEHIAAILVSTFLGATPVAVDVDGGVDLLFTSLHLHRRDNDGRGRGRPDPAQRQESAATARGRCHRPCRTRGLHVGESSPPLIPTCGSTEVESTDSAALGQLHQMRRAEGRSTRTPLHVQREALPAFGDSRSLRSCARADQDDVLRSQCGCLQCQGDCVWYIRWSVTGSDDIGEIEAYLAGAPVLRRVVEANITVPARMGGRLVVSCAEIWTTLIVIHYATVGSEAFQWHGGHPDNPDFATWQSAQQRSLQLNDDLGTVYPMASGGGGGGGDLALSIVQYQTSYKGPLAERACSLLFWPAESAALDPVDIRLS